MVKCCYLQGGRVR